MRLHSLPDQLRPRTLNYKVFNVLCKFTTPRTSHVGCKSSLMQDSFCTYTVLSLHNQTRKRLEVINFHSHPYLTSSPSWPWHAICSLAPSTEKRLSPAPIHSNWSPVAVLVGGILQILLATSSKNTRLRLTIYLNNSWKIYVLSASKQFINDCMLMRWKAPNWDQGYENVRQPWTVCYTTSHQHATILMTLM